MKKIYSIILSMMLLTSVVNAATRYSVATGNWNSTATWSASSGGPPNASVPVAGDVVNIEGNFIVTIPAGVNAFCTTLNVTITGSAGGTGTLTFASTATLTVSGNVNVGTSGSSSREGTINMTAGGTLTITGNLTIGNDGTSGTIASEINQGTGSSITVGGNASIITPGNNNFANQWGVNAGTATVTGTFTMANTGGATQDCNLIITTGSATLTGNVTMSGAANENSISITGSGILNLGGSISATNGTFSPGAANSVVNYNGAAQTLRAATYENLTVSGSGTKTFPAAVTVNDVLSVQLAPSNLAGTAPTFGAASTLEYAGSALQTSTNFEFPAASGPFNLKINNGSGVTLHAARSISGALTLTAGILTTTSTNLLTFNAGATSSVSSNTSFVNGPVRKAFNAGEGFIFPIGVTGIGDEPLSITGSTAAVDIFTAEYLRNSATALGGVNAPLLNVSNCDYWTLTKNSGAAASVNVTLSWDANSTCGGFPYVTDPSKLTVAHFTGPKWDEAGTSGSFTGTNSSGTVTRNAVTAFSPFSLGNTGIDFNPLPVKLSSIKAYEKMQGVQIDWTAYSEDNLSKYQVERSADGISFISIGYVNSLNSVTETRYGFFDPNPLQGISYYRLKNIDLDGKFGYSTIVRVNLDKNSNDIRVYPNPATGGFVSIQTANLAKGNYTVKLFNAGGQQVYSQRFTHTGGSINQTIQLPTGTRSGMYNMQLDNDAVKVMSRTFMVQ